jgi:hypothetical protein
MAGWTGSCGVVAVVANHNSAHARQRTTYHDQEVVELALALFQHSAGALGPGFLGQRGQRNGLVHVPQRARQRRPEAHEGCEVDVCLGGRRGPDLHCDAAALRHDAPQHADDVRERRPVGGRVPAVSVAVSLAPRQNAARRRRRGLSGVLPEVE